MAWKCTGTSHAELIKNLSKYGIVTSPSVRDAMLEVDRRIFIHTHPYRDEPQSIGFNAAINAPHMHAYALEVLAPKLTKGASVLDIGSGSGYLCACFSVMVGAEGKVTGVEHIPELKAHSERNLNDWNSNALESKNIEIVLGDGVDGYPGNAPYDAIHVGAAYECVPSALIEQLKPGGRMVIPIGSENLTQYLTLVEKEANGTIVEQQLMAVMYSPLTDIPHQLVPVGEGQNVERNIE